MPFSSSKLKDILTLENVNWNDAGNIIVADNHQINEAIHLFEKIEDDKIQEQREKLNE